MALSLQLAASADKQAVVFAGQSCLHVSIVMNARYVDWLQPLIFGLCFRNLRGNQHTQSKQACLARGTHAPALHMVER